MTTETVQGSGPRCGFPVACLLGLSNAVAQMKAPDDQSVELARRLHHNEWSREWAAKNRAKSRAIKKKWRDRNKAKQHALTVAWQRKNREKINKQARERYAANLNLSRARLKAKRLKMGVKYRAQIKRSRAKVRGTVEGMLGHRMGQALRNALGGAKRRCKWETLLGYSVAELRTHLEGRFTEGMTWERFFGGEIHIDHIVPRVQFRFRSPQDEMFRQCWALLNLRPLWAAENSTRGAVHRWSRARDASDSVEVFAIVPSTLDAPRA